MRRFAIRNEKKSLEVNENALVKYLDDWKYVGISLYSMLKDNTSRMWLKFLPKLSEGRENVSLLWMCHVYGICSFKKTTPVIKRI